MKDYSVPSLDRGMAILELLAGEPDGLGLVEIAASLDLPHNAVFRIGSALVQRGYLLRDEQTKKFSLSRKMLAVGLGAIHERNIVESSLDTLRAMRNELRESTALGTLLPEQGRGVVLVALDHLYDFGSRIRVGFQFDLHCSAPGKALVAMLPDAERRAVLERVDFTRYTPKTLLSAEKLEPELIEIRRCGYALDREEYVTGGYCVGAPILDGFGYPLAAIWTSGLTDRLPKGGKGGYEALGQRLKHYAALISAQYAGTPRNATEATVKPESPSRKNGQAPRQHASQPPKRQP